MSEEPTMEVPTPALYHVLIIKPQGVETFIFASDVDFSGQWNIDNYDQFPVEKLEKFNSIMANLKIHFDPGEPESTMYVTRVNFEEIPHFFYHSNPTPQGDEDVSDG